MARKCSHCGNKGHNSRTCSNPRSFVGGVGLKLFGVQLHVASPHMGKSFSMDCLSSAYLASSSSSPSSSSNSLVSIDKTAEKVSNGYLSDDIMGQAQERKKGVPWTKEEHRRFLDGLEKLGKGDWRGISRNFVTTRTPTQVASHAQKYFLRQNSLNKKKRRSSLFDAVGGNDLSRSQASQVYDKAEIDLNVPEQVAQLPPHLFLFPIASVSSSPGIVSQPSASSEKPHFHIPLLDLELTISSPEVS